MNDDRYGKQTPLTHTGCPCGRLRIVTGAATGTVRAYCSCQPHSVSEGRR